MLKHHFEAQTERRVSSHPAGTSGLSSWVAGFGYQRVTSHSYSWNGLKRGRSEFAVWQYCLSGLGRIEYEGETYDIRPGEAMLIHIPHDHRYFLPRESGHWEFVYLTLTGPEVLRHWLEVERAEGPVASFGRNSAPVRTAWRILDYAKKGKDQDPYSYSAMAYEFVMDTMSHASARGRGAAKPAWLSKAVEHCMQHLEDGTDVTSMAAAAGYSKYHFMRMFKKETGVGPAKFLRDLRMRSALRLLQTEKLSVKELAERTSYRDTSYFCKAFRSHFGMTPGRFRKG